MDYSLALLRDPHSPRHSKDRLTPRTKQPSPRISRDMQCKPLGSAAVLFPTSKVCYTPFENSGSSLNSSVAHQCPRNRSSKQRPIRQIPYRKLNTAEMQVPEDFYHHPLDWSSSDYVAVMLNDELTYVYHKNLRVTASQCPAGDVIALKFSRDGTELATGSSLGPLHVIDFERDEWKQSILKPESSCCCIDFKERMILGAHDNGTVSFIDLRSAESVVSEFKAHDSNCCVARFNSDGGKFATTARGSIKIWDTRNLEAPSATFTGHESEVRALAFSPTAPNRIVTGGGSNDKYLKVWDCETCEVIFAVNTGCQICNAFWNGEKNEIVTTEGFYDNTVTFWDASELKIVGSISSHTDRVLYCALSDTMAEGVTLNTRDGLQFWKFYDQVDSGPLR